MSSAPDQDPIALSPSAVAERNAHLLHHAVRTVVQLGIWEWNPVTRDNVLSAELHDMFGTEAADPERTTIWAARVYAPDWPMVQLEMEQGLLAGALEFEYRYVHPKRGLRWFYCKGGRLAPDNDRLFGIVLDVTDRKQNQETLQYAHDDLEQRVGQGTTELNSANTALYKSEETFRLLVESVQDYAIFMLDPEGYVLSWNDGAQRMKGYRREEIVGRHFSVFYPPGEIDSGMLECKLALAATTGRVEEEGWRVRKDGTRFWATVLISALYEKTVLRGFAKITRDITHRKEAELLTGERNAELARATEELRRSEEQFRLLVEDVQDYAIFMLDPGGCIRSWNIGARRIKGYTSEEIIGRHFSIFYPAPDIAAGKPARELAIAMSEGRYEEEGLRKRKDGSTFWASVVITALYRQGELRGFAKVTRDITERKRSEEAVRTLSGRLLQLQDEERRRLARELHDSTGQLLSALLLNLTLVEQHARFDAHPQVAQALTDSLTLADQACSEMRTLSYLLHPPLLDEAGLHHALRWYIEGFVKRTRIAVESAIPEQWTRLARDLEMALFRIVQESLTNIHRHSGSATAEIRLKRIADRVMLEVRDYGTGIPPDMYKSLEGGINTVGVGLRGMAERVRQLDGSIEVTRANPGTLVRVVLPAAEAVPEKTAALLDAEQS